MLYETILSAGILVNTRTTLFHLAYAFHRMRSSRRSISIRFQSVSIRLFFVSTPLIIFREHTRNQNCIIELTETLPGFAGNSITRFVIVPIECFYFRPSVLTPIASTRIDRFRKIRRNSSSCRPTTIHIVIYFYLPESYVANKTNRNTIITVI